MLLIYLGNTLLEGVCIRHPHNHDMTYVLNMDYRVYACMQVSFAQ